jgi:uncharacterized protein YggE
MNRSLLQAAVLLSALVFLLSGCMTPSQAFDRMEEAVGDESTISVSGSGTVEAEPDTASLQVSINEVQPSTREAQDAANRKVARIIEAAQSIGLDDDDVRTQSLSIGPEYEWKDGERNLVGQRVRQTLQLTVGGLDLNPDRVASLIDLLGVINSVEVTSLSFSVDQTEVLYEQARDAAFRKAEQKARQFAELGKVELGKPISISEQSQENVVRSAVPKAAMMMESADYAPTQIPSGSFSVQATVHIVFAIE